MDFVGLPKGLCIFKSTKEKISAQAPWGDTLLIVVSLGECEWVCREEGEGSGRLRDSGTVSREIREPLGLFSTSVSSPIKGGGGTVSEAPFNCNSCVRWALDGSRKDLYLLPDQPPAPWEVLGLSL